MSMTTLRSSALHFNASSCALSGSACLTPPWYPQSQAQQSAPIGRHCVGGRSASCASDLGYLGSQYSRCEIPVWERRLCRVGRFGGTDLGLPPLLRLSEERNHVPIRHTIEKAARHG
jgi:hypothetical protein